MTPFPVFSSRSFFFKCFDFFFSFEKDVHESAFSQVFFVQKKIFFESFFLPPPAELSVPTSHRRLRYQLHFFFFFLSFFPLSFPLNPLHNTPCIQFG